MTTHNANSIERQWARLGVLLNCRPATSPPDLERLLIATAHGIAGNARLLPLVVTWLVQYGGSVAKHRLKRLIVTEAVAEQRAVLGLILETAIQYGAPRDLGIAIEACSPLDPPHPLFDVHRRSSIFQQLAKDGASAVSKKWGVWTPEVVLKADAIRPAEWLLAKNRGHAERLVRKGDLRCSIIETLALDVGGRVPSLSSLARLCGATRKAVRESLDALVREGRVRLIEASNNERGNIVTLSKLFS